MNTIASRLKELAIELPTPATPSANYVPCKRVGNLIYVSGQVPTLRGKDVVVGKLGENVSLEQGREAAKLCAINLLAQLSQALGGDLGRVKSVVRLGGFVNATASFGDHPSVINGASDLMVAVFGDAGRHARVAVGAPSLPRNVAVEVEALFEVE
jgi:enamine deaminase RidA (YjgF/YER057c/UK114 family)